MLDELFGKSVHWNDELVKEVAKTYKTRTVFKKGNGSAYMYAWRNHMLDDLFPKN